MAVRDWFGGAPRSRRTRLGLALVAVSVIGVAAFGSYLATRAPTAGLPGRAPPRPSRFAFARSASAADRWPSSPQQGFGTVDASRLVATLGLWRLYLVRTTDREICLELFGVGGNCSTGLTPFQSAPFEVISAPPLLAAIFAAKVARVLLRAPAGNVDVRLTRDHAALVACPGGSCRRATLEGYLHSGRRLFALQIQ